MKAKSKIVEDLTQQSVQVVAQAYEMVIRNVVAADDAIKPDDCILLADRPSGAYWSKLEEGRFCVLVVTEAGHLYLASATISQDKQTLGAFCAQPLA